MVWVEKKWTSWTPTVTQSVGVTVTVSYAKYMIIGNVAIVLVRLTCTTAGTTNNNIVIGGQPAIIQPVDTGANAVIGSGMILDIGAGHYQGSLIAVGATDFRFRRDDATNSYVGQSPNFALANTDQIGFQAAYEVA